MLSAHSIILTSKHRLRRPCRFPLLAFAHLLWFIFWLYYIPVANEHSVQHWYSWGRTQLLSKSCLRAPKGPWTTFWEPTAALLSSCLWLIVCPACHILSFFISIDYICPAPVEDFNTEPFTPTLTKKKKKTLWRRYSQLYHCDLKTTWMQPGLCKASTWLNVQSSALSILLKGRINDYIDHRGILAGVCLIVTVCTITKRTCKSQTDPASVFLLRLSNQADRFTSNSLVFKPPESCQGICPTALLILARILAKVLPGKPS